MVEKYIKSFQAITGRIDCTRDHFKYEADVCLTDCGFFAKTPAKDL
jgi:hypothetical protein